MASHRCGTSFVHLSENRIDVVLPESDIFDVTKAEHSVPTFPPSQDRFYPAISSNQAAATDRRSQLSMMNNYDVYQVTEFQDHMFQALPSQAYAFTILPAI